MTYREYWARNPPGEAIKIVNAGFGQYYVMEEARPHTAAHHNIRLVHVAQCDAARYELPIREQLDQIGWQMITISLLDNTRFMNPDKVSGFLGVRSEVQSLWGGTNRTPTASTDRCSLPRDRTMESGANLCREGFRPSCGSLFADCEGKIHFCAKLPGQMESAACWGKSS